MSKEKRDIQTALDILVELHESPDQLEVMKDWVDDRTIAISQWHVAQVVRYLIAKRDGKL